MLRKYKKTGRTKISNLLLIKRHKIRARDTQKGRKMRPYMPFGAGNGIRTRDVYLGKVTLYH